MRPEELVRLTEANLTFDETRTAVQDAIEDLLGEDNPPADGTEPIGCVWVQDIAEDWVVYRVDGGPETVEDGLWRCTYAVADDGTVTLGTAEQVHVEYAPITEARESIDGRIIEALGTDADGGRVFAVQIIERGTSKNGNRYPASVLSEAAHLYEGAKSFDHHRTEAEHRSSSVAGLVGHWENVRANFDGLEGELHVLPSRVEISEAFDESLAAQERGLPPIIGVSHDVLANHRPVIEGGRRFREATKIVHVLSVDVVADPSAGGKALRMVAGGSGDLDPSGKDNHMNLKQLLALLRAADPAKRAELLQEHASVIEAAGLSETDVERILVVDDPAPDAPPAPAEPAAPTEAEYAKDSIMGKQLVKTAVGDAGVGAQADQVTEAIMARLPQRFTEAQLQAEVENFSAVLRIAESSNLTPRVPNASVTDEQYDKLVEGMDQFFSGDFSTFHSFKQMYAAFTGSHGTAFDGEDFNREILRESFGGGFDSRMVESASSTTWSKALGDSVTRRLVTEYNVPGLQDWRKIVSSIVPVNDFRTQRIDRVGGYGILPTVAESAPYQPLTTPSDEEATYALSKKGGTEDLTLEAIANDDVRWISKIPMRLGQAAGRTLHDAIFGILSGNPTCTYDSVALFHASHSNTTAAALSYSNYVALRALMRRQAGYGDTANILDILPAFLIVPPELEGIAHQLVTSEYAPPATTPGATNVANLARGTELIVKGVFSDTNDWFLAADPSMVPTIEVGFYQGRENPELFTQADQSVGSMFNADKMTLKIRHIWSYAVVDHRGLQRGTQ